MRRKQRASFLVPRLIPLAAAVFWCCSTITATYAAENQTAATQTEAGPGAADSADTKASGADKAPSPWLAVPLISSNPKVGTSLGGMVSYLFHLDETSTSSMVGVGGNYSTTDSHMGGVFLRSFWDSDQKRLNMFVGGGAIHNDYEDYQGSGQPAQTTDDLNVVFARYLQQVSGHWLAGVQGTYTNYLIYSDDRDVQNMLDLNGLTGFDSVALGLVGMYDTRDNQNTPLSGMHLVVDNFAYREALGGEENFDVYKVKFRQYVDQGDGNVLAWRLENRWTHNASPGGYSSVDLRGYVRGQYLAPYATMLEVEQRIHVKGRFGVNLFTGIACLYGDGLNCTDTGNLYPSIGVGGQFMLSEAEKMVMTFDVAFGERGNNGFYMRFGQGF